MSNDSDYIIKNIRVNLAGDLHRLSRDQLLYMLETIRILVSDKAANQREGHS